MKKAPDFRDPDPNDLYWAAIALFPHLPYEGLEENERIKRAIQVAREFWIKVYDDVGTRCFTEAVSELAKESLARTRGLKKLIQPADEKDVSTAQVYLKMQHNLTYKTVGRLREQLIRAGIPFCVPEDYGLRSDGEYVLTSFLDKFAEGIRAKECERKRSIRAKKGVKKIPQGTREKNSGTTQIKAAKDGGQVHK